MSSRFDAGLVLCTLVSLAGCGSDEDPARKAGTGGLAGSGASGGLGGSGGSGGGQAGSATGGSAGAGAADAGTGAAAGQWLPNVYGNPWSATSLQNWNVGSPKQQMWSYRFETPRAGTINELHVFFVVNPSDGSKVGYADGTGGTVKVELCADDGTPNHAPKCDTGAPSTTLKFQVSGGMLEPGAPKSQLFRQIPFVAGLQVQAGTLYHAVFSNVDANPEQNWIGLDGLTEQGTSAPSTGRPSFEKWGVLLGSNGTWTDWSTGSASAVVNTPVMSVIYDDKTSFGCGYMEVWPSDSQSRAINASEAVRERFVASRDVSATAIHVRLKRVGSGGALAISLRDESDTELYSTSIDASAVDASRHSWVATALSQPWSMQKDKEYRLELRGSGGGSFVAHCIRDGETYQFSKDSVFSDGYAEFDRNDGNGFLGWYGWSDAGNASYQDGDLQFFFDTSP